MPGTTPNLNLPYPVPGDTVDVPRDVKALADTLDPLGVIPVGGLLLWPTAVAPNGWLLAKGQTNIPAATYPALAAVLGQTGGMINMPDFTDMFPIGAGANALLGTGGAQSVALTGAQVGAHNHAVTDPGHGHGGVTGVSIQNLDHSHELGNPAFAALWLARPDYAPVTIQIGGNAVVPYAGGAGGYNSVTAGVAGGAGPLNAHQHGIPSGSTGVTVQNSPAAATHENRPPFRAINFIIRAI